MKEHPTSKVPADAPREKIGCSMFDVRCSMFSKERMWRSLSEFSDPAKFKELARDEFFRGASPLNHFNRRNFLKLMGASLALAGLPACTRQPVNKIVPYVTQPENLVPGKPMFFATAMTLGGFATGLLAESHEGHPTKIEGNPGHPASLGATSIFHQAALLDLYDPDRSQAVLHNDQPDTWENFIATAHDLLEAQRANHGRGIRILTETITSPTLHFQLQAWLKQFPETRWHQWEAINRDNVREGARLAFGEIVETHHHFDKTKVIVSLEADFLYSHPNSVRHARDFASLRRARFPQNEMSRLYVIESSPTITGANADHRLPLRSSEIEHFAFALAEKLGANLSGRSRNKEAQTNSAASHWLAAIAEDLSKNRGQSLVIAGENQPPAVHALTHWLNDFLGNAGQTVTFTASAEANPVNQTKSLRELAEALQRGEVDALFVLGGNPAFAAPADFEFARILPRAKFKAHLGADVNETAALCDWHIPQNHFLESWSDARAFDGTVSIIQPLILPLYAGKSAHEILDALLWPPGRGDYDIVHDFWRQQTAGIVPENLAEASWRRALHDGLIQNSALPVKTVPAPALPKPSARAHRPSAIEITFRPDPAIADGRPANNGWLQELPKPITKLVWDNAALISPALAKREKLSTGDVIELAVADRKLRLPVWLSPGQADDSVALPFGYGRTHVGHVGQGTGFDVFPLRRSDALWFTDGVTLKKTGETYPLVTTQTQHVIDSEDRQILREGTFDGFRRDPELVAEHSELPGKDDTLFDPQEFAHAGYRWGMAIDLSACIGCNACIVACYAENNIPVVGKIEVSRGRIMQWIRVDNYFRGAPEDPQMTHQPVPCMQCENAPCEVVCPVGATVHDREGLNVQVYNRCIGTRYCSNNCPYKVRRFNFFQYADYHAKHLEPMWNPNVTVRWRGVMEKCTYCLQRISAARIHAEEENRSIRDGEVKTACQQVCPADAIVFGNLNDPASRVAKLKSHKLNYAMLGELNTRPRTTYLAKLRNPNPKLPT